MGCCDCLGKKGKKGRGLSRKVAGNKDKISQIENALFELRETEIAYGQVIMMIC